MLKLDKIERLETKAHKRSVKREERKDELAGAAIEALKQLGYARTSLRDIAELCGVSVGMMHYYFDDKTDLIKYCVRKYKADFVSGLDAIMRNTASDQSVAEQFAEGLCATVRTQAETHRLWYDIRSQALFDTSFVEVVDEIEMELIGLVSRLFVRLELPADRALEGYLSLDGAFRYCLHRYIAGDDKTLDWFHRTIVAQLSIFPATTTAKTTI